MPKNNNFIWQQHIHDVNCQNCLNCTLLQGSNKPEHIKADGLMRCSKGHWLIEDGEEEKFMAYSEAKKWNPAEFLERMAEYCEDYEPMGG